MVILPEVTEYEAIQHAVKYCSQNSTPADIFSFDGELPDMKLKYSVIVTHFVKFNFSALVEARPKTDDETEDRRFMDRYNGESCAVAFGSTGSPSTIEECFWPLENIDVNVILEDNNDPKILGNEVISGALNKCIFEMNTRNARTPDSKLEMFIKDMIDQELSSHYQEFYFSVKDRSYNIIEDSVSVDLLFFPYYEFSFTYNGTPYTIKICAHKHAEGSTGFFGGSKALVQGALPEFTKEAGGLFSKLKARKERKNEKEEQRDHFLNNLAPFIVVTY